MSITLTGVLIYSGIITFFILLILRQKDELFKFNLSLIDFAFIIYIFAFFVSKSVNSGLEAGISTFLRACQDYFIFLWLSGFISKGKNNHNLIKVSILIASLISITYGLLQFFNLDFFHKQVIAERLSGFHKNPYSYGGQLIIFFFFLLRTYESEIYKILPLALLTACFFCILNTSERAVILGLFVGLIFYFIFQKIEKSKIIPITILFALPFVLTSFLNTKLVNRIKNIILPGRKSRYNVRLRLWDIAISISKKNIFFGKGDFPMVYYQPEDSFPMQVLTHAHNVYLQILVSNGLIGLIAYINLFLSVLKLLFSVIKTNQYAVCLIAIIFSFIVEGFFEFFWGDSEVRYLMIYFMGFVLGNIRMAHTTD